jgi:ppGpp synthetase/RelA/SpoT-type nucleotidyltranferase
VRKTTWLHQTPTLPIIIKFLDTYLYNHDLALAERATKLIADGINTLEDANGKGVQAKVTCRAKMRDSLEEKLKMRNDTGQKPYSSISEIQEDIHNLAGVRVFLYTPIADQYTTVEEIICTIWGTTVERKPYGNFYARPGNDILVEAKHNWAELGHSHSSTKEYEYVSRDAGDHAIHYRVWMNKEEYETVHTGKGPCSAMAGDRVEIQVFSVFGLIWMEGEHSISCRSYTYGRLSKPEEGMLRSINSLVSSAHFHLQWYHKLVDKRTYKKILFRDEF